MTNEIKTTYPDTPKGKRSIRSNIYGNTVGYVSGKRFWEFGSGSDTDAGLWVKGYELAQCYNGEAWDAEGLL